MIIPDQITALYRQESELSAAIEFSVRAVESHISSNRMVFFPEYTDHSIKHIQETIATALGLATTESISVLTPEDAAALTLAALLHDLGMFLTREGFETLISPYSQWRGVPTLDEKPWHRLWEDFVAEAARFDGRTLKNLFGEEYRPTRQPPIGRKDWEDRDYLLVGEFLRRNHARLAHEMALYGLPGPDGAAVQICLLDTERSRFLADVGGLVARSHGYALRDCIPYLQSRYQNAVDPRRVHAVFLMVLLRVADYLQIQDARAPSGRTAVTTFQSPISKNEWNVHQSVRDVHNTGSDPEAIVVNAEPPDVQSFLRISDWLNGLQTELDLSWAILGEVFGLQKNMLSLLGMKIRRVRSNLDDIDAFAKRVDYAPARLVFDAANADLLKLLVGPLYNHDVGAGFRELLQNAIDAVRERERLSLKRGLSFKRAEAEESAEILLRLERNHDNKIVTVRITDTGVGMTLDTIRYYFLRAGASFRRSEEWRSIYEDAKGASLVLRAGRFGVGALAAFLLGDEMDVTTRHHDAEPEEAWHFSAKIDDPAIALRRTSGPVGTSIAVKVPSHLEAAIAAAWPSYSDELQYGDKIGHYFGAWPKVRRELGSERSARVKSDRFVPVEEMASVGSWRYLKQDTVGIFWTHKYAPAFCCNGIIILPHSHYRYTADNPLKITLPSILDIPYLSVVDPDARVSINLQRNAVDFHDFEKPLARSMVDDLIAHALLTAPSEPGSWHRGHYEGFSPRRYLDRGIWENRSRWALTHNGTVLADPEILRRSCSRLVLRIGEHGRFEEIDGGLLRSLLDSRAAILDVGGDLFAIGNRKKGLMAELASEISWLGGLSFHQGSTVLSPVVVEDIRRSSPGKVLRATLDRLIEEKLALGSYWRVPDVGSERRVVKSVLDFANSLPPMSRKTEAIAAVELGGEPQVGLDPTIADRWYEVLGTYVIPNAIEARDALLAKAQQVIPEAISVAQRTGTIVGQEKPQPALGLPNEDSAEDEVDL